MATYCIAATYTARTNSRVTFPEGKTWANVQDWYLKRDSLHIQWTGVEKYEEFNLNTDTMDCVDWKRPSSVSIYPVDTKSDETDYNNEIDAA